MEPINCPFGIHHDSSPHSERVVGTHEPSYGLFIAVVYMSVCYTSHSNHCTPNTIAVCGTMLLLGNLVHSIAVA